MMAHARSIFGDHPGVCLVTAGPGYTNAPTGLVNGDGSFGLNAMEFDTAARHYIPICCVIRNDQVWGMIRHGQEICYGKERVVGSCLGVVHYEKMVEALGGHGEFVTKDEEIAPALERALQSGKPACVNVMTDPAVTSMATLLFVDSLTMEKK